MLGRSLAQSALLEPRGFAGDVETYPWFLLMGRLRLWRREPRSLQRRQSLSSNPCVVLDHRPRALLLLPSAVRVSLFLSECLICFAHSPFFEPNLLKFVAASIDSHHASIRWAIDKDRARTISMRIAVERMFVSPNSNNT